MEDRIASAIAANRFGLGARPGELDRIGRDPRGWLHAQLEGGPPVLAGDGGLRSSAEILASPIEGRSADPQPRGERPPRARRPGGAADPARVRRLAEVARDHRAIYSAEVDARTQAGVAAERPFVERLTHFWTNHF